MMHEILKRVWEEEQMPEEWKKREIIPIYKQKGDPLECGNFTGIKLLEHGMKMFEKILARRLKKLITVYNMQFGFSPGKATTDAVLIIQQLQEKHLEVHKDLFFTFVDLEKTYDRVPRDLVYWCLQGTKSQYRENGRDGQQQERNKSKHQRHPRHEPQTGE